jgi:hypothetical protein
MTVGYLAEVDTADGTKYIGKGAKLQAVPYFFSNAGFLNKALGGNKWYSKDTNKQWFYRQRDGEKTVIIQVSDLQKGLRASLAKRMSISEYMISGAAVSQKTPKQPSNAVFKIQFSAIGVGPAKKRFVGDGKYGKVWNRQGDLRNHISYNFDRLMKQYKDATVLTIEIGEDGVTPSKITHTPIVQFYRQSSYGNKKWLSRMGQSMSSNLGEPRSPYA